MSPERHKPEKVLIDRQRQPTDRQHVDCRKTRPIEAEAEAERCVNRHRAPSRVLFV